jgi:hypothetical protein
MFTKKNVSVIVVLVTVGSLMGGCISQSGETDFALLRAGREGVKIFSVKNAGSQTVAGKKESVVVDLNRSFNETLGGQMKEETARRETEERYISVRQLGRGMVKRGADPDTLGGLFDRFTRSSENK